MTQCAPPGMYRWLAVGGGGGDEEQGFTGFQPVFGGGFRGGQISHFLSHLPLNLYDTDKSLTRA